MAKKDIIFELNYRPENSKEMQKTVLSRLGSFLEFKKEVCGFFFFFFFFETNFMCDFY